MVPLGWVCLFVPHSSPDPHTISFWNGGEDRFSRDNFQGLILTNTGGCASIGIDRHILKECICIGGEGLVPSAV